MSELVLPTDGTGQILKDALVRGKAFNWTRHHQWLKSQSLGIVAIADRFPPNRIYRVKEEAQVLAGAFVFIDGYASDSIGVTPLGTTPFVIRLRFQLLEDVTHQIELGLITEVDLMKSLASMALPPVVTASGGDETSS